MAKKKETESITIDGTVLTSTTISQVDQLKESQDVLYNIVKTLKENYKDDVNSINHNFRQADIRFTEMEWKLQDQEETAYEMFNELNNKDYHLSKRLLSVELRQNDLEDRIKWCGVLMVIILLLITALGALIIKGVI